MGSFFKPLKILDFAPDISLNHPAEIAETSDFQGGRTMATGTITSLGMGSSIDLQGMLDTQREADEAIAGQKLTQIEEDQAIKNELNSVSSQLLSMKTNALNLSLSSNYLSRSVTGSDTEVATATATEGTATGTHRIETHRLASSSTYMSQGASSASDSIYVATTQESTQGFADTDTVLAEDQNLEIHYGPEEEDSFTITAGAGGMTSQELADAINADAANVDEDGNALVTASTYTDEDGNTHLRIESAQADAEAETPLEVTSDNSDLAFAAPASEFSFQMGDGEVYSISVPAGTTLEDLAQRINEDEDNPGVTASVINTGTGDNPYQLVLEADDTGEDNRITMISQPPGLEMSEANGKGYTMTGDQAIDFENPVVIDSTNNTIVFREDAGDGQEVELTAQIDPGEYETQEELADAVEQALEESSKLDGNSKDYQVSIDEVTGKMVISESGTLEGLSVDWSDAGSTAAATLGFSQDMSITPAASSLNAQVTADGITYQRQENKGITDMVNGLTINLYSTGVTNISVENDTEGVKNDITAMVETYNALMEEIDANDDYDEDTETWGTLSRSSSVRSLKQDLQDLFSTSVDTGGSITNLMDLGIEFNRDGTMTLDETVLDQQLAENFDEVQALMVGTETETGLGDILNDAVGDYALSDGYINGEIDALDAQILRAEESYTDTMERIDKKYETMAREYAELDTYLAQLTSTQNYLDTIFNPTEES